MAAKHLVEANLIGARTVTPRNRIVLLSIAHQADANGVAKTTNAELEDFNGYKKSSIIQALRQLEDLGLISRTVHRAGARASDWTEISLRFEEYRKRWGHWETQEMARRRSARRSGREPPAWLSRPVIALGHRRRRSKKGK
jgi:DNA-binding HxlR family transcriptional regulator